MRFPVSFGQQRLWYLDQLQPGTPTYNMPYAIWLDGPLDEAALQRAMDTVVGRHGVLRTRIEAVDGIPEQVVAGQGTVLIQRIAPTTGDEDERTRWAESVATDLAREPFDLAAGPLARAALIAAGPDRRLFLLVTHHTISDGASMTVLFAELSAAYRAETTGEPLSLPPLWMEYGDYAVWQRERLDGEELDRLLTYWRARLHGAPQLLALPTDRPRPARQSPRGSVATVRLAADTTRRLAAVAAGSDVTMFMLFLTGFAAVLSRYARQSDVVIGTQVSGRTHTELEPMIGLFTNTVALRISLAEDPSFVALLGRVRDATLDALLYQELPFEKLVDELAVERTLAYSPLTQVLFVYGSLVSSPLDLPGVTARGRELLTATAKLDLTLYADTWPDQTTTLVLEYSTDLFDPPWADRFLRCMGYLLERAAEAPDTPVADLPLLSAAEQAALILGRGRQAVPAADDELDVRRLFDTSAAQVIDDDQTLPVRGVRDQAARIARVLADHAVGPEALVGLCLGRNAGMLAALLGVWWAGGASVPMDPAFPPARLAAMASAAGLRIVLSDTAHRDLAGSVAKDVTVICVDDPATTAGAPLDPVPVPADALAYVIFTSGSTGQPKGVAVAHRALANLLASFRRALTLGPGDRFVAVTTLSFDIALLELLLPGVVGADLVIATSEQAREPDRLRALIDRTAATAMQATPQTWRLLDSAGGVPAGLRLRLCGGEALPADLAQRLMAPGVELWNVYGPTETTVWSAAGVVTSAADGGDIGAPIDHTRMYVLDEHLRPVPVGVVGEVCLAGRGVARGYHGRPRATATAFRPDPWGDEPGARLYRTGDLGRWRECGGLELIGRNDHQVKIRGFRIECGEIEARLRAHRDVRQAVVAPATRAGAPELVAYVVPRRGSALAGPGADLVDLLRVHLREALPEYMVPALIVALPALPLTPNAKVDRTALPAPRWGDAVPTADHVPPRSPVEQALARIWGDLLDTQAPIGIRDNLFAIGGNSLTATRLVARVADTYGVKLAVHEVVSGPTIEELAVVIAADPAFGQVAASPHDAELDGLSDEALDELLRAVLAVRNRRQATGGRH